MSVDRPKFGVKVNREPNNSRLIIYNGIEFRPFAQLDAMGRLKATIDFRHYSFPPFNVEIGLKKSPSTKYNRLTPTNLTLGYPISDDDYYPDTRRYKLERLNQLTKGSDLSGSDEVPHSVFVYSKEDDLQIAGITKIDHSFLRIKLDFLRLLRNMRVQLSFPDFNYYTLESKPDEDYLQEARLMMKNFYPASTGPLATDNDNLHINNEGLPVYLPQNQNQLNTIIAKFILLNPQPFPPVQPRQ